mgnify:FL=1
MIFSSIPFLLFFLPLTIASYYYVPNLKLKNFVLLIASCFFYAWGEPKYIFLILFSILINYRLGLEVSNISFSNTLRKLFLAIAIFFNLGILFVFKYFNFAARVFHFGSSLNLAMPIGISFFTFQILSYMIDVYKSPSLVQKNIFNLALYIMFFPQMIAGPIVRYHDINFQIENRKFNLNQFYCGIQRFILGLAKKVLIANYLAKGCDNIFCLQFNEYGTAAAWIAIVSYSLQIYYDFSGYSDMAIGLGKMFGFDFLENFNFPYMANSIKDFWRRWHISLSSWFKDYVYIPLGGNRRGTLRTILNKYIVFFLTGLWHGASFNFIVWGLGHGTLMMAETFFNKLRIKENIFIKILKHIYALLSILFLWTFFRMGTKESIKFILKLLGINYTKYYKDYTPVFNNILLPIILDKFFFAILFIAIIFSFKWWKQIKLPETIKNIFLILLLLLSIASLASNSYNPFIYFRF